MKKLILTTAILISILSLQAQDKKGKAAKPEKKVEAINPSAPAQDFDITIKLKSSDFSLVFATAPYGFGNWVKTTETPANQIDGLQQYFLGVIDNAGRQYNAQFKAHKDSVLKAKSDTSKIKK